MKRSILFLFVLSCLLVPSLLNANDISVTGNIATDSLIDSVALSPDTGMAYGIDKQTKSLYIIDLGTHTVTNTVSLARRPIGIAANPSNNLAYVTLKAYGFFHKKGSLYTIDSNGTILNTLTINGDSHGIAVNPENNTIVITLEREKKLLVLSADTLDTLQEISLPYKPRLVAIDTDSNRAVVTAGKGLFSWWQHIVMIVDTDTGTLLNTITLKRGIKGVAVDTGKDIGVTTGLKEINLFDISTASLISSIKNGDDYLNGINLKGCLDNLEDDENTNDSDINTNITSFFNLFNFYNIEIDEAVTGDLRNAGSGLSDFQNDSTYGLDINQSTHIAVIAGEESLLLLDLNTNTLNEYPITDINRLRSVAVDKYRNISIVSYLKNTAGNPPERGILEVQLPNPVPEITSISPSGATVGDPGCTLRVEGDKFITSSTVKFNQLDLDTTFTDNNTLDAIVPSTLFSNAGIFPVTVTNPIPAGGESNGFSFLILNPVPSIITLEPSQAIAGTQGLDVNISGTGFINTTMVYVNGTERSYTRISSTEIILSLSPADLETGGYIEIAASNPPPGGGMSNSAEFAVLNPIPVLSSISPDTVTAASPGFTLSLTGSNFLSTTTAYFNNSLVSATFINSTQMDIAISSDAITTPGTYTVKVSNTAPGGGESASLNLTVESARIPDLGISHDEQQGGGGLVGGSIRILNGNVMESRNDLQFSSPNKMGLSFNAFYNSRSDITGALGYGWTHTYEVSLDTGCLYNGQVLFRITDNTGAARYFKETSPGLYQGVYNEHSKIIIQDEEYIWQRNDGSGYGFNLSGKLIWIEDEKSNRLEISYGSNGLISSVTDTSSGRILIFNYNADNLLENITGPITSAVPDGMWVQYGYDSNGNLVSVSYADGSGFKYSYTDPYDIHNLTEKKDKANHLLNTWSYDDQDRAVDNFSKDGLGTTVCYISDTQVTVTDAYGTIRTYGIEGEDDNKRVTALSGIAEAPYSANNAIRWEYDENMNLVEVEYAGGTINLFQNYNERGNPGTVILASGTSEQRTIHYTYHPGISVPLTRTESSVLGSGSKTTVWDYDNDYNDIPNENPTGNVSRVIEQGFTANDAGTPAPYEYITKITYNNKGQVLSIDGPLPGTEDITSFAYDPATGDLVSTTMPHIGSTQFADYDSIGQPGKVIDVNNHTTTYIYDAGGKITSTTHEADLSTQSTSYNAAGFIESRTDEDGVSTGYIYDETYGRLQRMTDHQNNHIEYLYDTYGNVTDKSYYDAGSNRTNWKRYDYQHPVMPGKLYREIKYDDTFTQYAYDAKGNVSSVTDYNGNTTAYEYDALNRLVKVTQPGSIITLYAYDGHGNLASVTDAESHTTTYLYDDMGRLIKTVSPDTGAVKYAYDEAGNLKRKEDAKGIIVQYEYDNLNRLTAVHFPDSSQDISYTYDQGINALGFRSGITDQSGTINFGYDNRGRLTNKTSTVSGQVYPLLRTYTPGGRVSSLTYPTGRTIDYHRASCACSVDSITTTFGVTTDTIMDSLAYRPFGGANAMNNGAGGIVGSQYDLAGRLTVANPGAEHEETYGYDNNGNLTSISSPSTPWRSRTYGYDAVNRLTHTEGPFGTIDYTYDNVGNRFSKTAGTVTETYSYVPSTNKIDTVSNGSSTIYIHDANGNITEIGNKVLTYNQNNRLIMVEENNVILGEYIYNALGQRVIKEAGGVTNVFHYDFDGNIIGESDTSGNFSKEYLYRGSNRLVMVDVGSGELYYYGNDKLGTPQILTNSTNTVVWEGVYKPFGEVEVNPNSTVVNNFRFLGQYYDEETGLHYNYHRYYDPETGRYLTPDPIGLEGGINLFLYASANPIRFTDPLGLYCKIVWGNPHPSGDPLRQWESEEKIGYWEAVFKWILVESILNKSKLPIPNFGKYEYTVQHTIWQLLKEYINYWEVCYDDCTHEETSRKYIGSGETGKTQEVIIKQWNELREID